MYPLAVLSHLRARFASSYILGHFCEGVPSREDTGMSLLARARFLLAKFLLLLVSMNGELADKVLQEDSEMNTTIQAPDCPLNHISSSSCIMCHVCATYGDVYY